MSKVKKNTWTLNDGMDMLYLCGCVLKEEVPKKERLEQMDFNALLAISRYHSLTAIVCEALEMGRLPECMEESILSQFRDAKAKSIRKNLLLDFQKLELENFERDCRELVEIIFADIQSFSLEKLSMKQKERLKFFVTNGTYGTTKNVIIKSAKEQGKYHPVFGKYRWLMPAGWVYRWIKRGLNNPKKIIKEINILKKVK